MATYAKNILTISVYTVKIADFFQKCKKSRFITEIFDSKGTLRKHFIILIILHNAFFRNV